MKFITVPICYVEEADIEKASNLKTKPKEKYLDIAINAEMICAYIGVLETKHTMVYLANGSEFESTLSVDEFDDLLQQELFVLPSIEDN